MSDCILNRTALERTLANAGPALAGADESVRTVLSQLQELCDASDTPELALVDRNGYKAHILWSGVEDIAFLADSGQFEEGLSGMDEDQRNAMYEEICNQVDWDEVESAGIAAGNDVLERCLTEAIDRKCV